MAHNCTKIPYQNTGHHFLSLMANINTINTTVQYVLNSTSLTYAHAHAKYEFTQTYKSSSFGWIQLSMSY